MKGMLVVAALYISLNTSAQGVAATTKPTIANTISELAGTYISLLTAIVILSAIKNFRKQKD